MQLGYTVRASYTMLGHPAQGIERFRGRLDRRRDKRELLALGRPPSEHYAAVSDWSQALHKAIERAVAVSGIGAVRRGHGTPPFPAWQRRACASAWPLTAGGTTATGRRPRPSGAW